MACERYTHESGETATIRYHLDPTGHPMSRHLLVVSYRTPAETDYGHHRRYYYPSKDEARAGLPSIRELLEANGYHRP
jgi:hypothetical protein